MSKEEFLKTQTCVLKVNIHCEGCKAKVKKVLHKIEGVYTTSIDSELGKVTVSGNVDPATLIKKLNKKGKFAEIWGATTKNQLPSNANNQHQMKNLQIGNGKGGNGKNQPPQKGAAVNSQPKGGVVATQAQNPQLQQLQQMKVLQDLKNQMKVAANDKDQKPAKSNLLEEEGLSDDEFDTDDEFDDYDDDDEDELEDEIGAPPVNKMKPVMGNPPQQMANMMMKNMLNGQQQQGMMKNVSNGANPKKPIIVGNIPAQFNAGGGKVGGKKGGGGGNSSNCNNNNNSNGGAGKNGGGKGGKNGGGALPQDGKNGGGGDNKNAGGHGSAGGGPLNASSFAGNGSKKAMMNDGHHGMPNMMPMNAAVTGMGPTGHMAMAHPHMTQMPNNPSPQPFPPAAGAYFPSAGADQIGGIPYTQQQQYAAMMMSTQQANGNERFQPMVYARPPPAVSYMPPSYPPQPYPYYYPYPPPRSGDPADEYAIFSDENTQSCNIM